MTRYFMQGLNGKRVPGTKAGLLIAITLCGCLWAWVATAAGGTHTWTGAGGNKKWSNPSNWNTGKVPGIGAQAGDNVVIKPQAGKVDTYVELDIANVNVASVTVNGTFTDSATLVREPFDFANSPTITNGKNGFVTEKVLKVNSNANTADANPGDGACADSASKCSLRAAIEEGNASGQSTLVEFSGLGNSTFANYPALTLNLAPNQTVFLAGSTVPNFNLNNPSTFIQLSGPTSGAEAGLTFNGDGSQSVGLSGFDISSFGSAVSVTDVINSFLAANNWHNNRFSGAAFVDLSQSSVISNTFNINSGQGFFVSGGGNNFLQNIRVQGNGGDGAQFFDQNQLQVFSFTGNGNGGNGLFFDGSNQCQVYTSTVGFNQGDGLLFQNGADSLFSGITSTGNDNGFGFIDAQDSLLVGSTNFNPPIKGQKGAPAPVTVFNANLLSGNTGLGLFIGNSSGITVQGSLIGTNAAGTAANANGTDGITLQNSSNVTIGGTQPGQGNIISGNTLHGIDLNSGGTGIVIRGNFIGTNKAGTAAIANNQTGIKLVDTAGVLIGGTTSAARNVVSGNKQDGISIASFQNPPTSINNLIQGNFVGLNAAGTAKLGNGRMGISIGSPGNTIGGAVAGAGNLIGGNTLSGIEMSSKAADDVVIQGNFIGTNAAGANLGNSSDGITLNTNGFGLQSGVPGASIIGNTIGFNSLNGVDFFGNEINGKVQGNFIGTNAAGANLGNGIGVLLTGDSFSGNPTGIAVGGASAGQGNVIAFNKQSGVAANVTGALNCPIRGNSIFNNTGLGIDLGFDGVTANDAGDADAGANNLQNFPVLSGASLTGSGARVQGTLNSTASTAYTLDFFANTALDPTGNGEGQVYLGSSNVATNVAGSATFDVTLTTAPPAGHNILTATATDPNGNTSEFAGGVTATQPPSITINDVVVQEGATTRNAVFTVTLSQAATQRVTVNFTTVDDVALAVSDYTAKSGTVTFDPGVVTRPISVAIPPDTLDEDTETFFVDLRNPTNAILADSRGIGRIQDDDEPPTISINDVVVTEGNIGTTDAVFTVALSAISGKDVKVDFATSDNNALSPADYTATTGTLTIPAGAASRPITVLVKGDTRDEDNETFRVFLSNPLNATLADSAGIGRILDDDDPASLVINDAATVVEGPNVFLKFVVRVSTPSGKQIQVDFATQDATAIAPGDYVAQNGTLTIPAGGNSATVQVQVNDDSLNEDTEALRVVLSNPVNGTLADSTGIGRIQDNNDPVPSLAINDVSVTEGDGDTTRAVFTVKLSAPSGKTVSVDFATSGNSATEVNDYIKQAGTLVFAPGETEKNIFVPIVGDDVAELTETFRVGITNAIGATIADSVGLGYIRDDDGAPLHFEAPDEPSE